jgi:hypothetical protein
MWWVAGVEKPAQAIQDRWWAICRKAVLHLIRRFQVRLKLQPTQMAIPLQKKPLVSENS